MRCTQYVGLNEEANLFLEKNGAEKLKDSKNKTIGMFMEDVELSSFRLKDRSLVHEYEQCSPWSSGPMIFTCLEREDGSLFCGWDDDTIDEMLK